MTSGVKVEQLSPLEPVSEIVSALVETEHFHEAITVLTKKLQTLTKGVIAQVCVQFLIYELEVIAECAGEG
jgi:hypothetical protein